MNPVLNLIGTPLSKILGDNPFLLLAIVVGIWVFLWIYKEVRKERGRERDQHLERLDKVIEAYANIDYNIGRRLEADGDEFKHELGECVAKSMPYIDFEIIELLQRAIDKSAKEELIECRTRIRKEIHDLRERNESVYPMVSGMNIDKFDNIFMIPIRKFIAPVFDAFWIFYVIIGVACLCIVLFSPIETTTKTETAITVIGTFFLLYCGGLFIASFLDKRIIKEWRWLFALICIICLTGAVFFEGWKIKTLSSVVFIIVLITGGYIFDKRKKAKQSKAL